MSFDGEKRMYSDLEVAFTEQDYAIIESYRQMLEGLAQYFGEAYEFVLHSLDNLEYSAVKVINGYHTGRKEGAPITDLALNMLERIANKEGENCICYNTTNRDGHPLYSTTVAIEGTEGKVIALLCINCYLDTPFSQFMQPYVYQNAVNSRPEVFLKSSTEMLDNLVNEAVSHVEMDEQVSVSNKKKEIVNYLYEKGVFEIKDSVVQVARLLGISKNTVYLHLRGIKEKKQ